MFLDNVKWSTNDFRSSLHHLWKSLANNYTCDQKIVNTGKQHIMWYIYNGYGTFVTITQKYHKKILFAPWCHSNMWKGIHEEWKNIKKALVMAEFLPNAINQWSKTGPNRIDVLPKKPAIYADYPNKNAIKWYQQTTYFCR